MVGPGSGRWPGLARAAEVASPEGSEGPRGLVGGRWGRVARIVRRVVEIRRHPWLRPGRV